MWARAIARARRAEHRGAEANALNARLPAGLSRPAGGGRARGHRCVRVRHPGSNGTASLVSPGWTLQRLWCGPGHHCPSGPWRCAKHCTKWQRPTTCFEAGTVVIGVAFLHLGPHTPPTTGLRPRVVGSSGNRHRTVSHTSCHLILIKLSQSARAPAGIHARAPELRPCLVVATGQTHQAAAQPLCIGASC